jgi:hypothetical protein
MIASISGSGDCERYVVKTVTGPDANGNVVLDFDGSAAAPAKTKATFDLLPSMRLVNLGPATSTQRVQYDVVGGVLRSTDLVVAGATPQPLASSIVNLKAMYGIDTDGDGTVDEWTPATGNYTPAKVLTQPATIFGASRRCGSAWSSAATSGTATRRRTPGRCSSARRRKRRTTSARRADRHAGRELQVPHVRDDHPVAQSDVEPLIMSPTRLPLPAAPAAVRRRAVHRRDRDGRAVDRRHRADPLGRHRHVDHGNLGFRQASIPPSTWAVENAIAAMFEKKTIADLEKKNLNENYYAYRFEIKNGAKVEDKMGVPYDLQGATAPSNYPATFQKTTDAAGNTIRYVIERMCLDEGRRPRRTATCRRRRNPRRPPPWSSSSPS